MDTAKANGYAIKLLSQREHSVQEMREKLARKYSDLDKTTLEALLSGLQHDGLLSDTRFGEALVRSRSQKGYGAFYIRQALAQKGVHSDLIDRLLEDAPIDWLTSAKALVAKRYPEAVNEPKAWAKAAGFLQRRGFSSDVVRRAIGERPY